MELLIQPLSDKIGTTIPLPYYATDGAAALDLLNIAFVLRCGILLFFFFLARGMWELSSLTRN